MSRIFSTTLFCVFLGKLLHLFWTKVVLVMDYKLFGDAIIFDTTYNINKFYFRKFCIVDDRMNSILFWVGFFSSEVKESFVWLSGEFLKYTRTSLATIIIDQDRTMKIALPIFFLDIFQCFCKWHITHKFADKIANVYKDKVIMEDLHNFFNNVESTDVFDAKWK